MFIELQKSPVQYFSSTPRERVAFLPSRQGEWIVMGGAPAAILDCVAWAQHGCGRPHLSASGAGSRGKPPISSVTIVFGFPSCAVFFLSNPSPYRSKRDRGRQERGPRRNISCHSALREERPQEQATSAPLGGSEGGWGRLETPACTVPGPSHQCLSCLFLLITQGTSYLSSL